MKSKINAAIAALLMLCPGFLLAGPIETVSLTAGGGGTHQGAGAIAAAITAVDTGGEIRILEAGSYNSLTVTGGKTYTIKGMVSGVRIGGTTDAVITDASAGPLNVTFDNVRIENSGLGRAVELVQHTANTTNLTFNNCVVIQSNTVSDASNGGEALRMTSSGTTPGGIITLNATGTLFETLSELNAGGTAAGTSRPGIIVNGAGNNTAASSNIGFTGLTVDMTSCTIKSANNHAFDFRGGDNTNLTFRKCELRAKYISGRTNAFVSRTANAAYSNSTFTFEDSYLYGPGECVMIFMNSTAVTKSITNNRVIFNRSTIDNRRFGARTDAFLLPTATSNVNLNQAVRIQFNSSSAATTSNTVQMYNSIVLLHGGNPGATVTPQIMNDPTAVHNGTTAIQLETGVTSSNHFHNTYICEGVVLQNSKSNGAVFANPPDPDSAHAVANSAMINFRDGVSTSSLTLNADGNIMITSATANAAVITPIATFIPEAGGNLSSTLAAAGMNSSSFVLNQGSSPLVNAGVTSPAIQLAIGGVEKRGFVRNVGNPDVGAFEFGVGPPNRIDSWLVFE